MAKQKRPTPTKPIDDLVKSAANSKAYEDAGVRSEGDNEPQRIARKWSRGMARHFRERFAVQLKTLRERAGLSLHALADKAGVDHSQLVRLESGERTCTLETAVQIAGALGVGLGMLTDDAPK